MILRSWLFVPGDSERKLAKSEGCPADVIIIDLEDSVSADNKSRARGLAAEFLAARTESSHQQIWVRINPIDQPEAGADLASIVRATPDGIVQPKPRSPEDVILLGRRIGNYEMEHEIQIGSTRILPVATETPEALFSLGEYRNCDQRLAGLTWGAEDLGTAVGALANRDSKGHWTSPYQMVRNLCLFAAHAARVAAIDTVFTNFRDAEGLAASCEAARRDGFSGKLAIHPDQVEPINRAFTPNAEEIARARRIVALFDAHPGVGTLAMDGMMLDIPHLKQARKILASADMTEGREISNP
jgi:citrate lyase subunit beta/citryl-CoA lyase